MQVTARGCVTDGTARQPWLKLLVRSLAYGALRSGAQGAHGAPEREPRRQETSSGFECSLALSAHGERVRRRDLKNVQPEIRVNDI
jgi:hypothetical protein